MTEEDQGDKHRRRGAQRWRRHRNFGSETVLITSAKRSRLADWRHRRHLYAGLQLSRIPLIIAAVGVYGWLHNPAIAAAIAVISLPLPWVAVLLANDPGEAQEKGTPKVYKPALVRQQREQEQRALDTQRATTELTAGVEPGESAVIDAEDPRPDPQPSRSTHPDDLS